MCAEEDYAELRMALRLDRAGIRTLFPGRRVQSVYLDTPFQRALHENLAGLSAREKIRLRWYGEATRGVSGALERKCRENSLGWKESLVLDAPLDVAGAERRGFVAELARRCDLPWAERLRHGLEPVQWISYWREYLSSADRRVRLTIDRELRFFDQRLLARLSTAERTPSVALAVLEVKCAPADVEHARDIVSRLSIPLGRCSKFVLASEPDHGPLPTFLAV